MANDLGHIALRFATIAALAGASVHAERAGLAAPIERASVSPQRAPLRVPSSRSRYTIDLLDESGSKLDSYRSRDRFYVLGTPGQRYSVRVSNPTDRRIEAVVSIDGLDVIDGEDADYVHKRGYIIGPHDSLVVEGFRTSYSAVAAFRFSSVAASYAERKGKGRNVGVVGVAIFEESRPVAVVAKRPTYRMPTPPRIGPMPDEPSASPSPERGARDRSAPRASATEKARAADSAGVGGYRGEDDACCAPPTERPGLGTEFGEQRYSEVSFTQFVRRNASRPDARGELRYNDRDGLLALGIRIDPPPYYYSDEIGLRETADPFPAAHFSQPPR